MTTTSSRDQHIEQFQDLLTFFYRFKRSGQPQVCPQTELPLTRSQVETLFTIHHQAGISIKALAERQSVSSSATTQLVEHLVEYGYLERTPDDSDRRSVKLRLSVMGTALLAKMQRETRTRITKLLDCLTDTELAILIQITNKLKANANADA